ncbi:MAG: hypothetical protein GXP44_01600 [bacterium]|nr:hypothetical protein [bacterium]
MLSKIIKFCKSNERDIFLAAIIILVSFASFGLGRLSKIRENKTPITIENLGVTTGKAAPLGIAAGGGKEKGATLSGESGGIVASKKGSKYHFPWCSGALRIKDSNKIWFSSAQEARKAGYTPAQNCKGLK